MEIGINRKRVFLTTLIGVISELVNKLTPLILVRVGQSALGLEAYGYTQYGFYLVDFLLPFILFGYQLKSIFLAKDALRVGDKARVSRLMGEMILLRSLHLAVIAVGLFYYLVIVRDDAVLFGFVFCALVFNVAEFSFLNFAIQKLHYLSIATIISKIFGLLFVLGLVHAPEDRYLFLGSILFVNAFGCLVSTVYGWSQFKPTFPGKRELVQFLKDCIPHGIFISSIGLMERLDLMTVESSLGLAKMGVYAGVFKLYQSLVPLFLMMSTIFFAESLVMTGHAQTQKILRITVRIIMAIAAPAVCGIWFVASDVIQLILGESFLPGTYVLSILVSSMVFLSLIHVLTYQVFVQDRMIKKFAFYNLLFLPLIVIFYRLMAEGGGIDRVALGVFIFKGIYLLGLLLWLKLLGMSVWRDMGFGVVPAVLMAMVLLPFRGEWPIYQTILVGVFVYGVGLMVFHRGQMLQLLKAYRSR